MPDPLSPAAHPFLQALLLGALGVYVSAFVATLLRPRAGRWPLVLAVLAHGAGVVGRGLVIGWLPTGKMDSFATAALAYGIVAVATWRPKRIEAAAMILAAGATLAVALSFDPTLRYPPPVLRTPWYPLHVPPSFLCYGLWLAAGASGLQWLRDRDAGTLRRVDHLVLLGFGGWTAAMIFGGIWGAVAWGAWFLWDPKFLWSVILWFHYVSIVHLRLTPSLREAHRLRLALVWAGCLWVGVAWVGTSFFFGGSSHAF